MKRVINEELFIAGWQHYDGEEVFPMMRIGQPVHLVREPKNEHDSNAIAVYWATPNGEQDYKIGFVPRTSNGALALIMDERGSLGLAASIVKRQVDSNPWKRLAIKIEVEL